MPLKNTKKPVIAKQPRHEQGGLLDSTRVKVLLVFLVGLVVGILSVFIVHNAYISSLTQRVESMAALISSKQIESVKSAAPKDQPEVRSLKQRLEQASSVNNDVHSIYLIAVTNTNDVYYLLSSKDEQSSTSARASEALKSAYFTGTTLIEGPRNDQNGTWLSATAPIRTIQNETVAMLGIDTPAAIYYQNIALAALLPVFGALLIMAVFVMTDSIHRRRQEAVRMRSELVSIASHELRTPLTGIRWSEETLLGAKLPKQNHETVQSMYDSTIRLQESIEDILQVANWQAGRSEQLLITSTDIVHILDGIFATQKLPAAQRDVTLEYARKWPKALVINCDAQRLKRVFNNLISNAIKYAHPNTAVTVSYERVGGHHVISITDRGIGIPKGEQEKVFAGFYRASNAVSTETNGTGMGLYMSRDAIEQHGGELWLTSEENKGTTVYIRLPG